MSPQMWVLRAIMAFEILRQPGFHRAVGRIHKAIHDKQHGRNSNPHEPLAPGEATADPTPAGTSRGFFKHFAEEIRNQFRGKPTDLSDKPPK
ncbi:MIOREX complex component 7 domain-containing protein [Hirsutella rhossiliensis]|uniref:MIOREX complex component 7 domain-containing protein n=1 Tax=Hirsutella rhossiliensis TaxID=111463 RepID=A0A9P8SDS4_9HYPO|nr:MIOREX complex component 7 domain-containing protein [Hirsutella rhossiliensis]KAH0958264.1 MIOREX complex component 7 domain-containing protein [Hirsutella rhossiliensis]